MGAGEGRARRRTRIGVWTRRWRRISGTTRAYHYTAPVSGVLALHEALRLVCAETLEKRFARHLKCSVALQEGITALGLQLYTRRRRAG